MDCKLITGILLFRGSQVLFVKYKNAPDSQTGWFLPNDILIELENPEDAARRIVKTQLDAEELRFSCSHFESFTGHDGSWHLIVHFASDVPDGTEFSITDTVSEMRWFSLDELPTANEVAHHGWALAVIAEHRKRYASP